MRIGTCRGSSPTKHFVDFENRAELSIQHLGGDVRQVEIDLILTTNTFAFYADLKNFASGNVAGDQIAVGGKLLLEEIPALGFRYG